MAATINKYDPLFPGFFPLFFPLSLSLFLSPKNISSSSSSSYYYYYYSGFFLFFWFPPACFRVAFCADCASARPLCRHEGPAGRDAPGVYHCCRPMALASTRHAVVSRRARVGSTNHKPERPGSINTPAHARVRPSRPQPRPHLHIGAQISRQSENWN